MDYKEKVIAILNSQELSKEQKEKLENIFPELKESEDERIRKELIEQIAYITPNVDELDDELNTLPSYQERIDKYRAWLEKQDEQKCTDKTTPKFNVGDWIVFNGLILHIDEVVNGYYRTTSRGDGIHISYDWNIDYAARLWTIEDVKDGDVLVDEDNNIGLYLEEKDDLYWHSCIYLGCDNYLHGINIGAYHKHNNTKPATKEQCDMLFQKMKEAGYEWDADKKELKKIEQNPAESTKYYNNIAPHFGILVEDLMSADKVEPKTLDADKVIEWLNENVADFWANPCNPQNVINQFKKRFRIMLTKEDYMKLPKERLAELLEERDVPVTHVPVINLPFSQTVPCYAPDGICTNPQRDCINCPKTYGPYDQSTIITTTET